MSLILRLRTPPSLPIEAECLRPDTLRDLSAAEVSRLVAWAGKDRVELGDLFTVERDDSGSADLTLVGDLSGVRRIGEGMTSGGLRIDGDAGGHLGARMSGGFIEVAGSVGDWAGAMMRDGLIRVRGNAGDRLGSAYPGERLGMRGGAILVDGDLGANAGEFMRRGLIAVRGEAGDGLGANLVAGSILAFGPVRGGRLGAGMKRGTIALFEGPMLPFLPTFRHACRYRPVFLTLYLKQLQDWGFDVPPDAFEAEFERYNGDLIASGKGEVLIRGDRHAIE